MKWKVRKAMWLIIAFGWWGVLYPELTLTEDTCRIVWVTEEEREEWEADSDVEKYYKLLSADPKKIKIKSRLLEILAGYLEKDKEEK